VPLSNACDCCFAPHRWWCGTASLALVLNSLCIGHPPAAAEGDGEGAGESGSDCSDAAWAQELRQKVEERLDAEAGSIVILSCITDPTAAATAATTSSSSSSSIRGPLRRLLQQGTCSKPAYSLNLGVKLDRSVDVEKRRCVI